MPTTDKQATDNGAKKRGAPAGNTNAIRHGFNAGKLPRKMQYIELKINAFRRNLEAKVLEVKGEVSLTDAATISSIIKWERHARLAEHWLRNEMDKLSPSDRLKFSEAIAKSSDQRDKNIRLLGLDRDANANVIDALYRNTRTTTADDEEEADTT